MHMYMGLNYTYTSDSLAYIDEHVYQYSECYVDVGMKNTFVDIAVTYTIGIWLPMILVVILYVIMYFKLRDEAKLRSENSCSYDSNLQMIKISRRFVVVVSVFHICYLPYTIQTIYGSYIRPIAYKKATLNHKLGTFDIALPSTWGYGAVLPFTRFLLNCNC